jgi:hypothetical protein
MLFFLGAALMGIWLLMGIVRADVHRRPRPPNPG